MNIIEAIKSGKPFRRKGVSAWFTQAEGSSWAITNHDILADDWETKEKSVLVTATKLRDVLYKHIEIKHILEELGL